MRLAVAIVVGWTSLALAGSQAVVQVPPLTVATATATPTATATATPTATATATVTPTPTPTATVAAANDWTSSMLAVYRQESGALGTDATGDTNNNLTNVNTVTADTTNFREGAAAGNYVAASNQRQNCNPSTTCTDLKPSGNLTFGCWVRQATNAQQMYVMHNSGGASSGYFLLLTNQFSSQHFTCTAAGGSNSIESATGLSTTTWYHLACAMNDTGDTLTAYLNGAQDAQNASATTAQTASNGTSFELSTGSSTQDWDGQLDECFVDNAAWTATQTMHAASCNISGALCECDPTTNTAYKACATNADCRGGAGICTGSTCKGRLSGNTSDCNLGAP